MPAKKRARARPSRGTPPKSRALRVGEISVEVMETPTGGELTINGQVIPVGKLEDGSYYSDYAPQQSFPSIDALARALIGEGATGTRPGGGARGKRTARAEGRAATVKATDDAGTTKVSDDAPTLKSTDETKLKCADDTGRIGG